MATKTTKRAGLQTLIAWFPCPCDNVRAIINRLSPRSMEDLWDRYPTGTDIAGGLNRLASPDDELSKYTGPIIGLMRDQGLGDYSDLFSDGQLPNGYFEYRESKRFQKKYADLIRKHIPWSVVRKALVDAGVFL